MVSEMSGFADCNVDASILARARRGDMKAHEVLYRAYGTPVYTLAVRMLSILRMTSIDVSWSTSSAWAALCSWRWQPTFESARPNANSACRRLRSRSFRGSQRCGCPAISAGDAPKR